MSKYHTPSKAITPINASMSFLYLDQVKVTQDKTGVRATRTTDEVIETIYLPVASLTTIVLGPGTSITTRAISTIQKHGCTIVWSGEAGVRTYASMTPENRSTFWAEKQAEAWADKELHLKVAKRMYLHRFNDAVDIAGKTLEQLRGMEGARVKQLYHVLAKEHGIKPFKRSYDPHDWSASSPVNQALSSANTCLYGIVRAAIATLACSTSLGFIHTGKEGAFVYDIADLYKAELTIPLAFSLSNSSDPANTARRLLRESLHLYGLLPRIVTDIKKMILPDQKQNYDTGVTMLWNDVGRYVPAQRNYGSTA